MREKERYIINKLLNPTSLYNDAEKRLYELKNIYEVKKKSMLNSPQKNLDK